MFLFLRQVIMASFQDLICYSLMFGSTTLVLLKAHTLAYKGCVGPKSTCLYILALGPFVYASTVLLGVAAQVFFHKRPSTTTLTTAAYGMLWTTRELGPLFRRWLHGVMMVCTLYTVGILLGAMYWDPWNILACTVLAMVLRTIKYAN